MFDYTVSKENSQIAFRDACDKIAMMHPDFDMKPLLVDVDGSTIQVFSNSGNSIRVYDDYDVGVVFVESDVNLNDLFA